MIKNIINSLWLFLFVLSSLEVQHSNGINKDKEEEENPTKMSSSHGAEEIVLVAEVFFQVNRHRKIAVFRDMD